MLRIIGPPLWGRPSCDRPAVTEATAVGSACRQLETQVSRSVPMGQWAISCVSRALPGLVSQAPHSMQVQVSGRT
jgi:hypothetical protein